MTGDLDLPLTVLIIRHEENYWQRNVERFDL
jgi:hypothetical protein